MPPRKPLRFWFKNSADVVERRKKLGLNQRDFWGPLGITQSGSSRYESGGRNIPMPVQILLQIVYGSDAQSTAMVAALRTLPERPEQSAVRSPSMSRDFGILP